MLKKLLSRRQILSSSLLAGAGLLLPRLNPFGYAAADHPSSAVDVPHLGPQEPSGETGGSQPGSAAGEAATTGRPTKLGQQDTFYGHSKYAENRPFTYYSRYHPSHGGDPESDSYMGKMVPGLRESGLPPVPTHYPDGGKLPFKMVNGVKEFELVAQQVRRELLPNRWMNLWGFNGSHPGPMIEIFQGDRVRFIVHNGLPDPLTVHWHGFEEPNESDGVPGLTQDMIKPGKSYTVEFDIHQEGTFFYHSHIPLQEAFGMVGPIIIHPRIAYDPPVDRDFILIYQNWFFPPNNNTADAMHMHWNWHAINGKLGPYTTPLVAKHGERIRVRLMDFSPQQHHPIHLHGHTFWITGTEGGRIPPSAWIPRNTTLIAVAKVQTFEMIANNPGDWIFHCHMALHQMNHVVPQVGPHIRGGMDVTKYIQALPNRPPVESALDDPGFRTPGYPWKMKDIEWNADEIKKIWGPRETRGMRHNWFETPRGLMNVLRVLPEDLYNRVMLSDEDIKPGEVFDEIARRREQTFRKV